MLRSRPLPFLGTLAYGIYLIHFFVLGAATKAAAKLAPGDAPAVRIALMYALGVGGSVVAAYALHLAVEKPLIRVGRRWADKIKPAAGKPRAAEVR